MKVYVIIGLICVVGLTECEEGQEVTSEDDADDIHLNETQRLGRAEDMVYHFFSKRYPNRSFKVRLSTVSNLHHSDFNAKKETLFIIHGWKSNNESSMNHKIRETILRDRNINVFVVDWSKMAGKNYISAKRSVLRVGQYVAGFIRKLRAKFGVRMKDVKFVGFSLGAHISGNAGAALNGEVGRIVGLDPAGPLFTVRNTANRLDKTDAQFVQVIHTNGGSLGFGVPLGHADYFPNGGSSQPGCGLDLFGGCSHSRAYAYYAESLKSKRFVARRCKSYRDYTRGLCGRGDSSVMGRFESDRKARGSYYLTTNRRSPFAKG